MDKMLGPQTSRLPRPRPRSLLVLGLVAITCYFLVFTGPPRDFSVAPYLHEKPTTTGQPPTPAPQDPPATKEDEAPVDTTPKLNVELTEDSKADAEEVQRLWGIDIENLRKWHDDGDREDPDDVTPGYETDGEERNEGGISKLQHEKDMRKMWRYAHRATADLPSSGLIYKNTLEGLNYRDDRSAEFNQQLKDEPNIYVLFTKDKPVRYNPYPDYNGAKWSQDGHAPHVSCHGPKDEPVEDLLVFKGRPSRWPETAFGSHDVLNLDQNLCWERETRLGQYGLLEQKKRIDSSYEVINWDNVNWADLQRQCTEKNAKRFDSNRSRDNQFQNLYPQLNDPKAAHSPEPAAAANLQLPGQTEQSQKTSQPPKIKGRSPAAKEARESLEGKEKRTAILLRSYTGKDYSENDKQVIRAMISELSLKTGGEYEVFLLVHVKDKSLRIFEDPKAHQDVLDEHVPREFHGLTKLWNDQAVWDIYTELKDPDERSVHTAQWLCVQKFSNEHPQFDFIWNWEMDFRYTGHHYDLLEKLSGFARKQPRKGMWERNERYYIPQHHGDYDTTFRKEIENRYGDDMVWGAPDLPFINPAGPKPPVQKPRDDNYEWGVGEEADIITVGPMFNPINSTWIIANHIWGFSDENHPREDLPRRTTIVTQSRLSKKLLDLMHIENLRGNHVASEMTPQTITLLHGLKGVYAPHPVYMDRTWDGEFLQKWFNPGPNGETGGRGSPMGWGRERRYEGTTWYYRAEPPNRIYNNWMGWADTGIGGDEWEQENGRPCLPAVMLHQVKNTEPTSPDFETGFELAYG